MKEWRGVADLCTGPRGADSGIDPSFLLDSAQTELLAQVISLAGAGPQTDRTIQESQREIDHTLFRKAHVQTGETLASYFHPWEQLVPTPMIGALVALLAPTFRTLASEYLSPHTFDWLLDQLDEAGDCSTYEELERRKVAVHVIDTPRVMILNLLGDSIEAPLNPYPQTLFAGPLSQLRTYRVQVPLRNIDPTGFTRERLAGLLRATAESLCAEIYPPKRSLARLWDLLDSSDQLAVDAARRKILY